MSAPSCSVTCAADCCSDCASVFKAMNSTPLTSASIMRLTAFTPPPPTPTTRNCGSPTRSSRTEAPPEADDWGRSGRRRRSWGDGVGRSGSCGSASARGGSRPSVSVLRNRLANGPSRMLARLPLPIREHLLCKPTIRVGRLPGRVVLQDGHPLHGRFRETDGLFDARHEHTIPEVLLEDLDRFLGVERPQGEHRGEGSRDL